MLKPGQIIKEFKSKKGNLFTLRIPQVSDAPGLMRSTNSVIAEDYFLIMNKKLNLQQEKQWLHDRISDIKKGNGVMICTLHKKRIVGHCDIVKSPGRSSHIGNLGIIITEDHRKEGVGMALIQEVLKIAKNELAIQSAILGVYKTNKQAIDFYYKAGFQEFGVLPKEALIKGNYVDGICMYKEL